MTSTEPLSICLTQDELLLVTNALEAFMSDFGHDESAVLDHARAILAKLRAHPTAGP